MNRGGSSPEEPPLDVSDPHPGKWAHMAAGDVVRRVIEPDGAGLRWRRRPASPPVIVVEDKFLTGTLNLRALEFPYVLEFYRCRFDQAPDLRQAKLAGLEFRDCWLPGLQAKNMRCDNDLVLASTTVDGSIDFVDTQIEGVAEPDRQQDRQPHRACLERRPAGTRRCLAGQQRARTR
ncbi:hypothetical protein [Kibdelosporangium aridum]|uniref:hypothetical protein n=1 Tax=Kibdelosporangium aridum TaxID=2030 RepID=UPI0035EF07C4